MVGEKKRRNDEDWRHLLPVGALVLTVTGTMLLGAVLKDGSRNPSPAEVRQVLIDLDRDPVPPAESGSAGSGAARYDPPVSELAGGDGPSLEAPAAGVGEELVDRTTDDLRRLGASGSGWTLQFNFLCDAANVRPIHDALADEPDFYLLTQLRDEKICFRICWGFYPNKERALAARDIPDLLRDMQPRPQPLPVDQVL